MTAEEHAAATDELIAAWIDWDAVCQNRPRHPSALWCDAQTRRLTAAETVLGLPLGYTRQIGALRWRRNAAGQFEKGMDVGDAVQTVVLELAPPPVEFPTPNEHRRAS